MSDAEEGSEKQQWRKAQEQWLKQQQILDHRHFDNEAYNFVLKETKEKQKIHILWKSIDDVDYTRVEIPIESAADSRSVLEIQDLLICKHCKESITSLDVVPQHRCFMGEEVFMDENQILFKVTTDIDGTQCHSDAIARQSLQY
ncbi:PREDICTED: uncharacterized protein LOC105456139 [Wasmannia auropunctata]|uniref:uncharacterized protein LOC105456139 n=1 Tax=Wasmannia auropunctata TaxID=64793 RepID=UPI0005EFCB01|nr:PREDICTED: uncharacterized protein LOC105456139 [Wasmannia auropunctata]